MLSRLRWQPRRLSRHRASLRHRRRPQLSSTRRQRQRRLRSPSGSMCRSRRLLRLLPRPPLHLRLPCRPLRQQRRL